MVPISPIPSPPVLQELQEAELLSFFPERIPSAAESTQWRDDPCNFSLTPQQHLGLATSIA